MRAWLTPNGPIQPAQCGLLWYPGGDSFAPLVIGAYAELLFAENYEDEGNLSPEDTETAFSTPGYHTARRYSRVWNAYTQKIVGYHDQGLIAYWPFWEQPGANSCRDLSGVGSPATPTNGIWAAAGIGDGMSAIDMTGVVSRINGYSAALSAAFSGDSGSLSLWANSDNWNDGILRYLARFGIATSAYEVALRNNAGTMEARLSTNSVFATVGYAPGWANTGYHHFLMSWSLQNGVSLFIDGVLQGNVAHPGTWGATSISAAIIAAYTGGGGFPFDGKIAHVALWNAEKGLYDATHLNDVQN